MAFQSTEPKIGDSDNNLLYKIAQNLNAGGGGGGDSIWQFTSGSIHPINDTRKITSNTGNLLLDPAAADGSTAFGFNTNSTHTTGYLFIVANNGTPKVSFDTAGGIIAEGGLTINGAASIASGTAILNGEASDDFTPYVFDTSVAHTSGNLFEVKNNNVLKVSLNFAGTLALTAASARGIEINPTEASAYGFDPGGNYFYALADGSESSFTVENSSGAYLSIGASSGAVFDAADDTGATANMTLDSGIFELRLDADSGSKFDTYGNDTEAVLSITGPSGAGIFLEPTASASTPIFRVNSGVNHTSGSLVEFKNNGALKASLDFAGKLDAVAYSVGGTPGDSGTITAISVVTVVNGIITNIA